jgi:4'-phosphopantetheinyl transferase
MEANWLEQSVFDVPVEDDWLSPWEVSVLRGMRFPKRRADWRLGRWTAKLAVASYLNGTLNPRTLATIEIRPDELGAPTVMFENKPADVSISLSHRSGTAACAVAPTGVALGCDLEVIEPRSEAFVTDYFTEDEQAMVRRTPEVDRSGRITMIWSAKESVLKVLRVGLRVDTRSVAVTFLGDSPCWDMETPTPSTSVSFRPTKCWCPLTACYAQNRDLHGWWQRCGEFIRTLVAYPSVEPPIVFSRRK